MCKIAISNIKNDKMNELKRIINKKNIYVIMLSLFMCISNFIVICNRGDNTILLNDKNIKTDEYISYINNYHEYISNILNNAEDAKKISIFSNNKFIINNINNTYRDYKNLEKVQPVITNVTGFNTYIMYIPFISIFVLFIMIYCIFNIINEYDNGEIIYTYSCSNGRLLLSIRRNIIFTLIAIILIVIFNSAIMILSGLILGFPSCSAPIQSSILFKDCTFRFGILEFYLLNIILSALGICALTMIANFMFILFRNKYVSIILTGFLLFFQYQLSLLSQNSSKNIFLSNINLYKMLDFSDFYKNYQNINILNRAIKSSVLIIVTAIFFYIIFFIGSNIAYIYRYPVFKEKIAKIKNYIDAIATLVSSHYGFLGFELHKIFIRKKKFFILIILFIIEFYLIKETEVHFPQRQITTDEIYMQYGGESWDNFSSYLEEYRKEILNKKNKVYQLQNDENNNENFQMNIREISKVSSEINEMEKILEEYESIEARKIEIFEQTGITIYAMSDRGYNEIFGKNSVIREIGLMFILVFIAVLIGAEYYQDEILSGLIILMNITKKGVQDIFINKMKVIMLSMLFIIIFFLSVNYIALNLTYGFKYLNAPILSLNFMQDEIHSVFYSIKIWQYLLIDLILKILLPMLALMTTLVCSLKFKTLIFTPVIVILTTAMGSLLIFAGITAKIIAMFVIMIYILYIMSYIGRCRYRTLKK